jgi:IS5 family transposase
MRATRNNQLPLMPYVVDSPKAKELEIISAILDKNDSIYDLASQDLCQGIKNSSRGAKGMTVEQVVRAAIVKQIHGFTYEELAFHLADSATLRCFCRIGIAGKTFKRSVLCKNIKRLSSDTWESINRTILNDANERGEEKGREVRIDCTVVESNIHDPTDSSLLWDIVRVLTRILLQTVELFGLSGIGLSDHTRTAKRRLLEIEYAKNEKDREKGYRRLLKATKKTVGYAKRGVEALKNVPDFRADAFAMELIKYIELAEKVIDQTERRVFHDETVPATEKVVSIFEDHTDVIKKDRRETFFGHKTCLTQGASQLILDCVICDGNPADSTLSDQMLDRQKELYGRYPLKAAMDGGFASKANLESAKVKGVKDVCFAKKRGLEVEDMCRSQWVYNRLRRFRAGIEAGISWLKRCFGFDVCTWKGHRSFKSYVWASIVSANLLTLARLRLEPAEA